MKALGHLAGSVGELVAQGAIGDGDAVIDGGTGKAEVVGWTGTSHNPGASIRSGRLRQCRRCDEHSPTSEQSAAAVSVDAQSSVRQAADILAVQVAIDPANLPAGVCSTTRIGLCAELEVRGRSHGISWLSGLQKSLELSRITALDEEGVGIVASGQRDAASGDALLPQTIGQLLRGLLAAAVGVDIEGQINGSRAVAQLSKLAGIEMGSHRTGDVVKTCLPQHGLVEHTLDENHFRIAPDLFPCIQAALGCLAKTGEVAPRPRCCGHTDCLPVERRCDACKPDFSSNRLAEGRG